jgi:hypothetical protein
VLSAETAKVTRGGESVMADTLGEVIQKVCRADRKPGKQAETTSFIKTPVGLTGE